VFLVGTQGGNNGSDNEENVKEFISPSLDIISCYCPLLVGFYNEVCLKTDGGDLLS